MGIYNSATVRLTDRQEVVFFRTRSTEIEVATYLDDPLHVVAIPGRGIKGRGLGVEHFNPVANNNISDALIACPSKLHLQEDFITNNYVVYNAYKHD